ncbi:MAG: restriction endonuclease subunit S, partial [Candidatus Thiodiazotropha taylori]|nr:restriction endonuclease subunit S [Candidatus Thiodiazotropha taylori]MCW4253135.1 restriction endonuclease subunit S [Candidatus Thiodiazotropha taylori]
FMPSVANTIGSNMANYKLVKRGQFACSLMQVRRDKKMPVALLQDYEEAIVSPAYPVFEIIDENQLLPEYLMMWMLRPEFDREACFYAVGGVRGSLEWDDLCAMQLPIPSIDKQREIVKEYRTVVDRIRLNERMNEKLEEAAQAIYKQWFVEFEFPMTAEYAESIGKPELAGQPYKSSGGEMEYNEVLEQEIPKGVVGQRMSDLIDVRDGTHDSPAPSEAGYFLVTSKNLENVNVNFTDAYRISEEDFDDVNRRSAVNTHDILISMIGTVGNVSYVSREKIDFAIKNVGLFRTSTKKELAGFLYFWLKSAPTARYISQCLLGSTQKYISLTDLRNIPVYKPYAHIDGHCLGILDCFVSALALINREKYELGLLAAILLGRVAQEQ